MSLTGISVRLLALIPGVKPVIVGGSLPARLAGIKSANHNNTLVTIHTLLSSSRAYVILFTDCLYLRQVSIWVQPK